MDALTEQKLMAMISDDPSTILLIRDYLVTDNMWKMAIQSEPGLFKYMDNPSYDMCMLAVNEDGQNLKYCVENPTVELTSELCYAAITNYPPAILEVPSYMRDDRMKEYAFDLDPTLVHVFSDIRPAYLDRKLREDPTFCRYLQEPTEEMEYKAIEHDPNYCGHVHNFTPRIRALIQALYPEIVPMLPACVNNVDSDSESLKTWG